MVQEAYGPQHKWPIISASSGAHNAIPPLDANTDRGDYFMTPLSGSLIISDYGGPATGIPHNQLILEGEPPGQRVLGPHSLTLLLYTLGS